MLPLNEHIFRLLFPRCPSKAVAKFLPYFNAACLEFEINTGRRLAHFAAQLGHESGDLRWWEEFASGEAYDTGRLAERLGNTPERDHDGERLKGRGPAQLTGHDNYEAAGKALGVDLLAHPERAAHLDVGFRVAGWFFQTKGVAELADRNDAVAVSKRWNGGTNHLDERIKRTVRNLATLRVG